MAVGFGVQLAAFAAKTKGRIDQVVRKTVFMIATSLVEKSPVGDGKYWINPPPKGYVGGRFRANWQLGIGSIDYATNAGIDPAGEKTLGAIFIQLADAEPNQVFYLANSLPYAQRLEEGWSYRQAPLGMVGITVVEFQQFMSEAVREAKQ